MKYNLDNIKRKVIKDVSKEGLGITAEEIDILGEDFLDVCYTKAEYFAISQGIEKQQHELYIEEFMVGYLTEHIIINKK